MGDIGTETVTNQQNYRMKFGHGYKDDICITSIVSIHNMSFWT